MLRISRIRLCEYNKSCSIFHNKSNKIEFAFVWIFYDFLRILQVLENWIYYWSCSFAPRPLERFSPLQCGPWPWPPVWEAEIRWLRRGDRPGKGMGRSVSSLVTGFWSELGWSQRRRTQVVRPCGGGRRNGGSSGLVDKARWPVAWTITVGACASASGLRGVGEVPSRELGAGAAMAARMAACPRRNAAAPSFIGAREKRLRC
jgi:hypothetical protein